MDEIDETKESDETLETRLPLVLDELTIRRIGFSDLCDLEYWTDPEVARYQLWGPYSEFQISAVLESQVDLKPGDPGETLFLAAELAGKVIGDCSLTVLGLDDRQAEIGFKFNPRFTGRGLATRTVAAVLGFGFIQLGMHRITAATDTRNERSWRLMERVGMRREAHFIHDCLVRGEWVDAFVYAMLEDEWRVRHAALVAVVANGEG